MKMVANNFEQMFMYKLLLYVHLEKENSVHDKFNDRPL